LKNWEINQKKQKANMRIKSKANLFRNITLLWIILILLNIQTPTISEAKIQASFDCLKARALIEKLICSDKRLVDLDFLVAGLYTRYLNMSGEQERMTFRRDQRKWLELRLTKCSITDKKSIKSKRKDRMSSLT